MGIRRGFQKGITLGCRTSRSVRKVWGGGTGGYGVAQAVIRWWVLDFRVYPSPMGDGLRQIGSLFKYFTPYSILVKLWVVTQVKI